jgi:hypothetical protein
MAFDIEQNASTDDSPLRYELDAQIRQTDLDLFVGYAAVEAVFRVPNVAQAVDL